MDNFFKNIKDNLENRPEPAFDERGWRDMENRLDRKRWGGAGMFAWALPIALAMLFLSNIFFFKKLNDANTKINNLELIADTIYKTRYIYQYDTVYHTSVETEYVTITKQIKPDFYTSQIAYKNLSENFYRSNQINTNHSSLTFAELKYLFDDEQEGESSNFVENSQDDQFVGLVATPFIGNPLFPLGYQSEFAQLAYLDVPAEDLKRRKRPLKKVGSSFLPINFQAGIMGGLAFPQYENVIESGGFSVGIYGAVIFSERIRLWTSASYYRVEFKSDEMGKTLGIPEITIPDDEYEFVEASINQPFYQYTLGLEYILLPKNKWSPYFGVGYALASMRSYEVGYDFEHITDNRELSEEEMVERNELISNMALFDAGVQVDLSNRIGFQLEGYYRWHGNNNGLLITNLFGVRTKLLYNF